MTVPDDAPNEPVIPDVPDEELPDLHGWTTEDVPADRVTSGEWLGEEFHAGAFVGGEFRTSDHLPGQVTLSNTAYLPSWGAAGQPGIRVDPDDNSETDIPPGIGPSLNGMVLDGGRDTSGVSSFLRARPTGSMMRTVHADGTIAAETFTAPDAALMRAYGTGGGYGIIQAMPVEAIMRTVNADGENGMLLALPHEGHIRVLNANGTNRSRISATRDSVTMFTAAGGAQRYFEIDADGIWVRTARDGTLRSYNLETIEARFEALEARIAALEN